MNDLLSAKFIIVAIGTARLLALVVLIGMPQRNDNAWSHERGYVNTFLKMLFYTNALRRFDKPARVRREDNLLILWADEAQRFVSASD